MTTDTKAKALGKEAQDEVFETVRTGQAAVVDAFTAWIDAVRAFTPTLGASDYVAALPNIEELVSNAYDIAEKSLATQREFVEKLVAAATNGVPKH
ncbi:hypothetical protein ACQEVB_24350 [Pseudonocardia sp. CA-107938]|uniref:hypothetical protein n=1 Tax=Pseudonocardia sp. CA-107938 TaxID=3240021 RepID=UPI003D8D298A